MKCVFEKTVTLYEKDEKTNVPFAFELSDDAEFLKITYSYSPKKLESRDIAIEKIKKCIEADAPWESVESEEELEKFMPLLNLVTLSLDDSRSYRGAAHRQAAFQEHIISEKSASPGFIKGKIEKGQWQIVLNVHALVTEKCVCEIKIEAGGEAYE